ncbi:Rieske 2Fe-2S domain-containing protein [Actinoplanes subtropicus]|uniref:Rieske 2Fe-2S domain-containing protein n=1 Tax=Actinoplanes subtropicus TaxID=543632 RepID=UPI000A04B821|nr:Rieske 2Fe-2S domain-containing protein [Actinoplanes subtropicus]
MINVRIMNRSSAAGPTPADEAIGAPLPYPEGWFCVGTVAELRKTPVVTRRIGDRDVVVYRTESGVVRATDPYCPHLGAHLGTTGRVAREALVCGFHGFEFGAEGACVRTAYAVDKPPAARLTQWPVCERGGLVFVWFSPTGHTPSWEPTMLGSRGFPLTAVRCQVLPGHPQDVVENAVDIGHLSVFHKFYGIEIAEPISFDGPHFHARYRWKQRFPMIGTRSVEYETSVSGLGYILVTAEVPKLGLSARMWAMATPIAPWRIEFRFATSISALSGRPGPAVTNLASATLSRALTRAALLIVSPEATRDVPVWATKTYLEHPRLVKGDGPIGKFRHWAGQFYAKN